MENIVHSIIINILSSFILLCLGILYLRFRQPQIKIHRYIAAYRTGKRIEYQFKIVNFSKIQEANKFSIKLRGVVLEQCALNVFIPSHTEIPLSNDSSLIQLDRHKRYSFIKCVKTNHYGYAASYLIITYEPLEKLLKNKYSYLQFVVRYTNTNNKEFTVKREFTKEEIKSGHHTNDDNIKNEPVNKPVTLYYFAYGSNLNKVQMKERCPDSKEISSTLLSGYELKFRSYENSKQGYLTIEKSKRAKVPIGIYEISENDEKKLDSFEGVDKHEYKKERIAIKCKNKNIASKYIRGLIYTMIDGRKCKPCDEYYTRVKLGYDEWNFDISYLKYACNECEYSLK
jgi:gamma-glutamylcyclotransferase (GGCT)/AIG2-like uncharacterized protein YtfP